MNQECHVKILCKHVEAHALRYSRNGASMLRDYSDENRKGIAKTVGKMSIRNTNVHYIKTKLRVGSHTALPLHRITVA